MATVEKSDFDLIQEHEALKEELRFISDETNFESHMDNGIQQEIRNIYEPKLNKLKNDSNYYKEIPQFQFTCEKRKKIIEENKKLMEQILEKEALFGPLKIDILVSWRKRFQLQQTLNLYKRKTVTPPIYDYRGALGLFKTYVNEI